MLESSLPGWDTPLDTLSSIPLPTVVSPPKGIVPMAVVGKPIPLEPDYLMTLTYDIATDTATRAVWKRVGTELVFWREEHFTGKPVLQDNGIFAPMTMVVPEREPSITKYFTMAPK